MLSDSIERNYSIDYFKFYAIMFVVCIHTGPFEMVNVLGIAGNKINFVINTIGRFAVPFFFAVTGFILGEKILKYQRFESYFKKYLIKTFKILVSWTLFYLIYDIVMIFTISWVKRLDFKSELLSYISNAINFNVIFSGMNNTSYQLWYLVALIWSIFILFIFVKVNKVKLLILISLVLNILGVFAAVFNLPIKILQPVLFGLFYTTIGFQFSLNYKKIEERLCHKSKLFIILFFIFLLIQLVERTISFKYFDGGWGSGNYFLSTIPLTICLLVFVILNKQLGRYSILSMIGQNSIGIYVTHTFFISLISNANGFIGVDQKSIFYQVIFTPTVILLSHFSYSLLQKFKTKTNVQIKKIMFIN